MPELLQGPQWLDEHYDQHGMSITAIAERLTVSRKTVRRALLVHGFALRSGTAEAPSREAATAGRARPPRRSPQIIERKTCSRCSDNKPVADYRRRVVTADGWDTLCGVCRTELERADHQRRADAVRAKQSRHRQRYQRP